MAPRAWWNFTAVVGHAAKVPADWLTARLIAVRSWTGSRPSSSPAATAAPTGPMTPGACQPRRRNSA